MNNESNKKFPLKKLTFVLLAICAIIFFGGPDKDCEDCLKIVSMTVNAENLSENEIKSISDEMFKPGLYEELDQLFPKYAGTFKTDRLFFKIRTVLRSIEKPSTTTFSIGFKYQSSEEKQNPSIAKDAELAASFLTKKLYDVVKPFACKDSEHENCQTN